MRIKTEYCLVGPMAAQLIYLIRISLLSYAVSYGPLSNTNTRVYQLWRFLIHKRGPIIIINAYFPFRQNGDDHKVMYMEVLGSIKEIIDSNPSSKFIILGDLNYDIYDPNLEISCLLRDFLSDNDLCCSHDMDDNFSYGSSFTRSCMKTGSYSLLDYIFFSSSLRERVSGCQILYAGENPSDHNPVQLKLEVVPQHAGDSGKSTNNQTGKINWSLLNDDDLCTYESVMSDLLDTIQVPDFTLHGNSSCFDSSHCTFLEQYFQSLIDIIAIAESHLPKTTSK